MRPFIDFHALYISIVIFPLTFLAIPSSWGVLVPLAIVVPFVLFRSVGNARERDYGALGSGCCVMLAFSIVYIALKVLVF